MKKFHSFFLLFFSILLSSTIQSQNQLSKYNITWNTPSLNSSESMPLGNGDVGINLWTNTQGEILFFVSKTDAWSDCGRLLKLGLVKISLEALPQQITNYSQTLDLYSATASIHFEYSGKSMDYDIWIDAHRPIIHILNKNSENIRLKVQLSQLPTADYTVPKTDGHSYYGFINSPNPVNESGFTIKNTEQTLMWYRQNKYSVWETVLKGQALSPQNYTDPIQNLTMGCAIKGLTTTNINTIFVTQESKNEHHLQFSLLTETSSNPIDWETQMMNNLTENDVLTYAESYEKHSQWWQQYWEKSYIEVSGDNDAEHANKIYSLQRYMNACGGRGKNPIKFNGSIFTFDFEGKNANYRMWGGANYWQQNTRLLYWNMFKSGDTDLTTNYFKMYVDNLPMAIERTQKYYGHAGAYFPETMYFWGSYNLDNYGWNRAGKADGYVENNYVRYHIQNGIEMVALMQEYYQFTENKAFLTDTLIPFAEKIYQFYLNHYSVSNGKLQISPAQVLETYWLAVNPMPEIAGLHWTISNFKQLETSLLGEIFLQTLTQIDQLKPDLPIAGGRLLPALSFSDKHNIEKGEMYAVYPYRIYSLINQNTPIGVTTFKNGTKRTDVENFYQYGMKADTSKRGTNGRVDFCWIQDAIFASNLGLKTDAKLLLLERWTNPDARFPVFWKFDWIPDQDHAANGMTTLQNMLLQADNGKILIVPSLPNEWNARFKLHAPMNTIVEAEYDKGELITLNVSPQSRMADVYILKNNELVKAEPKNVVSSIEINENKGLRIYPNPVSDYLSIELPQQLSEKTQLSVFNLMGQKMKITQISRFGNTIQLPVDELNVGVYYLQIVSKTYSESLNFIVK